MAQILGGDSMDRTHTKKLYDSFHQKDMPYEQFHRELNEAVDPIKLQTDLGIELARRRGI
jgi:hypothetical protein